MNYRPRITERATPEQIRAAEERILRRIAEGPVPSLEACNIIGLSKKTCHNIRIRSGIKCKRITNLGIHGCFYIWHLPGQAIDLSRFSAAIKQHRKPKTQSPKPQAQSLTKLQIAEIKLLNIIRNGPVEARTIKKILGLAPCSAHNLRIKLGIKVTHIDNVGLRNFYIWHLPNQKIDLSDFRDLIAERLKIQQIKQQAFIKSSPSGFQGKTKEKTKRVSPNNLFEDNFRRPAHVPMKITKTPIAIINQRIENAIRLQESRIDVRYYDFF